MEYEEQEDLKKDDWMAEDGENLIVG